MELGQLLLSNANHEKYEADWATDGLYMISQVIAEYRGKDPLGGWTTLASNSGDEDFINDVFEMRSYCWCEGGWGEEDESHPHSNGCPPNFVYKPNGFVVTWYKHAGRGIRANKEYPGAKVWAGVVMKCIESIK